MAEKVKVSCEVAEAIENALTNDSREGVLLEHSLVINDDNQRWINNSEALNKLSLWELAQILTLDYEVERTPEEKLSQKYREIWRAYNVLTDNQKLPGAQYENGLAKGIELTLEILNLKIKGINE